MNLYRLNNHIRISYLDPGSGSGYLQSGIGTETEANRFHKIRTGTYPQQAGFEQELEPETGYLQFGFWFDYPILYLYPKQDIDTYKDNPHVGLMDT